MKNVILLMTILSFCLISCRKNDSCSCLKSTGKIIRMEKNLSDFTEVEINNNFTVYISQDSINKITIEGGENLLSLISSDVKNGRLIITDNNKCNWLRSYKKELIVYLSAKSPESIIVNGQSKIISSDTLHGEEFLFKVLSKTAEMDITIDCAISRLQIWDGTGDFTLRGYAQRSNVYSGGTGYVFTENLVSDYVHVYNQSTGNCYVNCTKRLFVKILGSGNIYYSGKPYDIKILEMKSTGKLVKN